MLKTISSSDQRARIKEVLNEVGYGGARYIVRKFGEPTAAIISVEDLRLLQTVKQQEATTSLRDIIAGIRTRGEPLEPHDLNALIEEARTEFHNLRSAHPNAD